MPGTSLSAGDLAVIGYNSGQHDATGHPDTLDKLYFVLLKPVVSGSQIFLTDRSWNGTSFVAGANDGTVTYTAGADLAAGTVVEMSVSSGTATFTINGAAAGSASANGFDIETNGDAVYLYQGSGVDAPTSFLYASEFADGNTTFNGSLANTGLSVAAGTAAAISFDSGAYAGPTTYAGSFLYNGASVTLLKSIADPTNWTGADQTGQNAVEQHVQTGPWLVAADMDMWGTAVLGGGGIVHVSEDHTFAGGNASFNTSDLYNNLIVSGTSFFWHLSDMVFDTVAGKFFVVDSDLGGGHNRIMEGNISDLLSNPGTAPTMTTLYSDPSTAIDASNRLDNLEVDTTNHIVYFTHAGDLDKVNYNGTGLTTLFRSDVNGAASPSGVGNPAGSTSNFFNDMVIDFSTGHIYLSSTRVGAAASGDDVVKNYIYDLSGLTSSSGTDAFQFNASNTGTARLLPFAQNDANYDPIAGTSGLTHSTPASAQPYFFPKERGTLDGLALDPVTHTLYFSTGEILFDHDANSATAPVYVGGVVASYALTGNAAGNITVLFQQPAQSSGPVPGLMGDLEIDTATGHWYVTDTTGASGTDGTDQYIWSGLLGSVSTPTIFAGNINSIDSLTTTGMTINHAPTITGVGAANSVTEASNGPGSGETSKVGLFSSVALDDIDTSTLNELTGAVVRISSGFQSGATHQDFLEIGGATSGTIATTSISFTYSAATGAMVLTGAGSVAQYKAAIESVTFSTSGDDPTAYGSDGSRTIAASVSDGLSMSDEINATASVTGINDNPVNTPGAAAGVNEDSSANSITGVSVFDVDADPASQNITVTLSVAHGTITLLTNVSGGIAGGSITGGAGAAVNATSITITGTQNAINATLAAAGGLTYTPTGNYNGADALHIVTNDAGFNGNGGALGDTDDKVINITPVNDAPVVTGGTTQATTTIDEDTPLAAGQSISSLLGSHFDDSTDQQQVAVTNPTGSVANTLAGIAVTANGSAAGTGQWQYSTNGGTTWTDIGAVSAASAHLFNASTLIRFNPALNYNGAEPTLTVHLIDNSTPTVTIVDGTTTANLSAGGSTGGTTHYSTGTVDLGGTINAVNDAPVFAALNGTPTFTEGGAAVVLDNNATVTDVELAASGNYAGATLTLARSGGASAQDLFGTIGTLALSGGNVTVGATTVGTFTQSAGTLTISFNASATQALVNSTLDQITYSNGSDNPPSSATIAYAFNDGNAGAQGSGGALTGNGSVLVSITAVNDAPTATLSNHSPAATEGVALDLKATGLSVADIDGNSGSETVTLAVGQGILNVTAGGSGAGVSGSGTGTVTITGTIAQINALLGTDATSTVSYIDNNDAPAATTGLTLTIHDNGSTGGGDLSGSDSATISISAVNDAPVDTVPLATQVLNEDATRTFSTVGGNAISVADPDVGAGNLTVTLSVAHGTLSLNGVAGLDFSPGAGGVGDGTADTTMTFSGTVAAINTALNGLVYAPALNFNGADTLSITTNDNGNTGSPGAQQDSDTVAITVTAVNDAPVVAGGGSETLATIQEDQPQTNLTATTVGAIFAAEYDDSADQQMTGGNLSGSVANTLAGIAVVGGSSSAAGDWQYWDGAAWQNIGSTSAASAHLLNASTEVRFNPVADYNGASALTVRLVDSSGSAFTDNSVVDLSGGGATGGATRYSSGTVTLGQTVGAVADIADDSVTVAQDSGSNTLNLLANDTFENAGRGITLVTAASHGQAVLHDNGTPTITDDFVTYTPDAGYHGPDGFTYTVSSGGVTETANVTVNVTSPNAPPVVDLNTADGSANIDDTNTYTEGDSGAAVGTAIGVSDPDGDMIHSATIALSDPETGDQLFINGVLPSGISIDGSSTDDFLMLTGTASAADYTTALGEVSFRSTSDDPTHGGTHADRSIGVTVNDGLANSAPATMTLTVVGVDDAPVAQPDALTTDEATAINGSVFADNGSGADSDVDGPALSVSAVNGSAADIGNPITLASGALLTLNSDGTFSYDPNHAFDATPDAASGASNTPAGDSFSYTLAGGGTTLVSITVDGIDSNDLLLGTAGNDVLLGGIGDDTMQGGQGNDTYYVQDAGDIVIEAVGEGTDRVAATISYTLAAGVEVETLEAITLSDTTPLNLGGNEFANHILGNEGANFLSGGAGNDVLDGLGGDDVLDGGPGNDVMSGGTGNDVYYVDSAADIVNEAAGEGMDRIAASVSYALDASTHVEVIEAITLSATNALDLTGNDFANIIIGNDGANVLKGGGGDDVLIGLGGDDILVGGLGDNVMSGGTGNDTYYVDSSGDIVNEAPGEGIDQIATSVSYTIDPSTEVETLYAVDLAATTPLHLTGNDIANTIIGNAGDNVLSGGGGDDILNGDGGNDVLNGGTGADTMSGGSGDDTYYVDDAGDIVIEAPGEGIDRIATSISYTLAAGSSVEKLEAVNTGDVTPLNLTGNELDNAIAGNAGDNVIDGGAGNDDLAGLGGADSFRFTTALGPDNVDTIADFQHGTDKIELDHSIFDGLSLGAMPSSVFAVGAAATQEDQRIIYDPTTGALYYDPDGSGGAAQIQFATLHGLPNLTASDFTVI